MKKAKITVSLVERVILELVHYLQIQRGIEQQLTFMMEYDKKCEENIKTEELRERTRIGIELNSVLSCVKNWYQRGKIGWSKFLKRCFLQKS